MAYVLIVFSFLFAAPALAQSAAPCPTFQAGWGKQWPAPGITAVTYDETSLLMYIIWNYTFASAYSQVPLSIMQTFSSSKNPSQTYNTLVANRFSSLLLQEKNNCPILVENGRFISTNGINQ